MVQDVIGETQRRVADAGVQTIDEVRVAGRQLAGFSAPLGAEEKALKRYLYDRLYNAPPLVAVREEAQRVVTDLARLYRSDVSLLPPEWFIEDDEVRQVRRIGDFIAGMTDRFAIRQHEQLIGPVELPDRF
jgi:dGTPase